MTRIELAAGLNDDFDRTFDDLARYGLDHAAERIQEIVRALDVLATNPLIGRPAARNKRELIIGRRSHG